MFISDAQRIIQGALLWGYFTIYLQKVEVTFIRIFNFLSFLAALLESVCVSVLFNAVFKISHSNDMGKK